MMRFANDFQSWLRHSWKPLTNRSLVTPKSLFTITHALLFISYWFQFGLIKQVCIGDIIYSLICHWEIQSQSSINNFRTHIKDRYLDYFLWNRLRVHSTKPHWWYVNIGSGNGLVLSGNRPLRNRCFSRSTSPYCVTRPQRRHSV